MSIADKLNYLITTKGLLKDNINKINNVLTDQSTFRSYPQELFNGYLDILNNGTDTLWSNLEKVSQTGTEAVLENVENAPMKIELSGNTKQETTEGYNLADYSDNYISGNLSNYGAFNLTLNNSFLIDVTKTYYFSADVRRISGSGITKMNVIRSTNTSGQVTNAINNPNMTSEFQRYVFSCTYTAEQTLTQVAFQILTEQSTVIEVKNIMISTTNTDYEPYSGGLPSPSPSYPQEIKVVTGENTVSVSGKNFLDLNNPMYTKMPLQPNGAVIGTSTVSNVSQYIKVKENTKYTLSLTNDSYSRRIAFYSNPLEEEVTSEKVISVIDYGGNTKTFTTPNNCKYIRFSYFDVADNVQLEEGSTATPYVPYSKTDYPINLGDIELCKINTYKDYFHKDSGKWYVHKAVRKIVLDGTRKWIYQYKATTPTPRTVIRLPNAGLGSDLYFSSHFIKDSSSSNRIVLGAAGGSTLYLSLDNTLSGIDTTDDSLIKVAKIKTWLSNNNVTLYYVLATPVEEEITNATLIEQLEAISKAKSVKDKTYITQTNDELPFILDVEAIKEYNVA